MAKKIIGKVSKPVRMSFSLLSGCFIKHGHSVTKINKKLLNFQSKNELVHCYSLILFWLNNVKRSGKML